MARVSVSINNQSYEIACEQGQEQSVLTLAGIIDEKVTNLVGALGHVGESRLLVMAALLMADEMQELKKDITRIKAEADSRVTDAVEKLRLEYANTQSQTQSMTLKTLSEAARRMESIAQRIEAS